MPRRLFPSQLEHKVKILKDEFEKFRNGKMEFLRIEVERLGEGEWEAEQDMTEQMEKVATLAAERESARKEAQQVAIEHRAELRRLELEKDGEAALLYEEEMQTMHEDLETMYSALKKAENMHRIALEEEQVRERGRVEEVTRAELQVTLWQSFMASSMNLVADMLGPGTETSNRGRS